MIEVAHLLEMNQIAQRISSSANSLQWFTSESNSVQPAEMVLRQLARASLDFSEVPLSDWLVSPEMEESQLKQCLGKHPGDGLAQQMFPREWRMALSQRTEWSNHYCMSVLFVLLRARARQEENPKIAFSKYQRDPNWQTRWTLILLNALRQCRKRQYSYRIANLLGCEWIDDPEIRVARLVFAAILTRQPLDVRSLKHSHLDDLLFQEIESYLFLLLDREAVPLEQSHLMNIPLFLARISHSHLQSALDREERERMTKWESLRQKVISALAALIEDINEWLATKGRVIDGFHETYRKFVDKTSRDIQGTLEIAYAAELTVVGGYWKTMRFLLFCSGNELDDYFRIPSQKYRVFCSASR
jgi:hypothetical protein